MPDGCFNLLSICTDFDDYESLHHVIHKNKQCEAHWLAHLLKYAYHAKLLFVRGIVERTQVDLVVGDEYDRTPLYMAAENDSLLVVQYLYSTF